MAERKWARGAAVISNCMRYRYLLTREWDAAGPTCLFIMLNPSVGDATDDDPTIRRCVGFAKREGCGRLEVVNLFGLRTSHPADLMRAIDVSRCEAAGPANVVHVLLALRRADLTVVAWGAYGALLGWHSDPYHHLGLNNSSRQLYCLGRTKGGAPRHPLYVKAGTPLENWGFAEQMEVDHG